MDLDAIRAKWQLWARGMIFNNVGEQEAAQAAFEFAWREGYIEGHNIGNIKGIANSAIDRAMTYDR